MIPCLVSLVSPSSNQTPCAFLKVVEQFLDSDVGVAGASSTSPSCALAAPSLLVEHAHNEHTHARTRAKRTEKRFGDGVSSTALWWFVDSSSHPDPACFPFPPLCRLGQAVLSYLAVHERKADQDGGRHTKEPPGSDTKQSNIPTPTPVLPPAPATGPCCRCASTPGPSFRPI